MLNTPFVKSPISQIKQQISIWVSSKSRLNKKKKWAPLNTCCRTRSGTKCFSIWNWILINFLSRLNLVKRVQWYKKLFGETPNLQVEGGCHAPKSSWSFSASFCCFVGVQLRDWVIYKTKFLFFLYYFFINNF